MKKCRAEPLSRHDRARLADLNYHLTMPVSLTSEWLPRFRQASGRQAAICFHADNTIYQAPWNCCLLNARKSWAPGHQCHWDGDQWQQMDQGPTLPARLGPVTPRQQGELQVSWSQKFVSVQGESIHQGCGSRVGSVTQNMRSHDLWRGWTRLSLAALGSWPSLGTAKPFLGCSWCLGCLWSSLNQTSTGASGRTDRL